MAQEQTGGNLAGWRALVLIGALGNAVGLIGGAPVLTLVAAPLAIIGVIGPMSARRKRR
ncbi:hypothetical protein [Streptomyces aurantiogriseus]|uniref:Uncharacterized protein n=1 Tax=Streptomyces aurantiogriseus TaxID=66870 RepID=A0A918FBH6_9ACTN|nr:hypothetical protein [Streptomyces aurantiogriseus]GGR19129.1 hypothetical protein GCM10010251_39130 [Streptomyces aurantiogriseus]